MEELLIADEFIYKTLTGDAALSGLIGNRVYSRKAPQGAEFPYIVYQNMSAGSVQGVGNEPIMSNLLYLVKVINIGNSGLSVEPIIKLIKELLHRASGSSVRGVTFGCIYESAFNMLEDGQNGGPDYLHLGGMFRLYTSG